MQRLVGKLNFAQSAAMGRVGRVPLWPLYDFVMRSGGRVGPSTRWALGRRIRIFEHVAPRSIKPVGGRVDVRVYSDTCTQGAGMAAVASFEEDFAVVLKGGR